MDQHVSGVFFKWSIQSIKVQIYNLETLFEAEGIDLPQLDDNSNILHLEPVNQNSGQFAQVFKFVRLILIIGITFLLSTRDRYLKTPKTLALVIRHIWIQQTTWVIRQLDSVNSVILDSGLIFGQTWTMKWSTRNRQHLEWKMEMYPQHYRIDTRIRLSLLQHTENRGNAPLSYPNPPDSSMALYQRRPNSGSSSEN